MEHLRTQVAQFTKLAVGHAANGCGIFHDAGICHQNTRHIRPVFVDIGIQCRRCQRAGNVAAAAGKGGNSAVGHHAVESGDDHLLPLCRLPQGCIGRLLIHAAVQVKLQPQRRVEECPTEIGRHQLGGEILTAGGHIVLVHTVAELAPQLIKIGAQVNIETAILGNTLIALADHLKDVLAGHAVLHMGVAEIEEVCHLVIVLKPLAGCADHHHAAAVITLHDGLYFRELRGICHGRAAELQHF